MVEYHPISDQAKLHQSFQTSSLALRCLRVESGKESSESADMEELNILDASRRLYAKEVLVPKKADKSFFPCADGTIKLAGKGQDVPTSIPRTFPIRTKNIVMIFKERRLCLTQQNNTTRRMTRPDMTFGDVSGNLFYRHHVDERVKL